MTSPIQLAAREHPDRLAFYDGAVRITYRHLLGQIENSPVMKLDGLGRGDHVAWCPRNDRDSFLTFWALHHLGCVACPISYRYPMAEREKIVERLDAKWLPDLIEGQLGPQELGTESLERPATIVLSSGSTGIPKAVVHTIEAHVASARGAAMNMPLEPGDRWLWSLPLFHVSGLSILIRCAVAGATVVGVPEGSALDAGLLAARVHTTYGLTEMASQVTTSSAIDSPSGSGRVLAGRELHVRESGEILVRGETLCAGYYQDGLVHPIGDEHGWFHTGDLGQLAADGSLVVTGRIDNMFISGGENIHPERIERAMMSAFGEDGVEQVIVVPRQDETFGDRPVAFVCGQLPVQWEIEVLDWPAEAEGAIKPDRKLLQRKANSSL
jgi:O-succinylbenzoic acid--CoA ligase